MVEKTKKLEQADKEDYHSTGKRQQQIRFCTTGSHRTNLNDKGFGIWKISRLWFSQFSFPKWQMHISQIVRYTIFNDGTKQEIKD